MALAAYDNTYVGRQLHLNVCPLFWGFVIVLVGLEVLL